MPIIAQRHFALIFFIAIACRARVNSKVFERCELAKILHEHHHLDLQEVEKWVCIAQHSSGLNTATQAVSSTGGSHGLFQISDVYWCSPPGQGKGCNLPCHKLRDNNLSDDLACAKLVYNEHQHLSGDGYTAWNAYEQFCKQNQMSYIKDCFTREQKHSFHHSSVKGYNSFNSIADNSLTKTGKVYERCELARELYAKHKMSMQHIPTWVCIAEHESRLNTAAVGRLNADGSADHGLFQISDLYWCSHDRFKGVGGKACGLPCPKLLDNDITDDVHCVKRIFNEHTAISGDGFNAWTVYKPHCQNQSYEKVANCFRNFPPQQNGEEIYGSEMASNQHQITTKLSSNDNNPFFKKLPAQTHYTPPAGNDIFKPSKGKVYTRCSLAQEMYFKYNFPIQDIPTWVCIAEHESHFNTAAVGRLNTDESKDHGLFQINDRYWCDHSKQGGKACKLSCSKLLDDDIRDDLNCIKSIYEEHTRLSGDGFNAWTVYKPYCQNQEIEHIKTCFDEETVLNFETFQPSSSFNVEATEGKGKIYDKCELAEELLYKHHLPLEQIPKWVCIAEYESSFNTAAEGRLNADGSADHGLFQISDLYWCSHDQLGGKACNISCHKLLDSDISDDVECIKIIHEEHTRISEDGFNAWTVYQPHCHQKGMEYIKQCLGEEDLRNFSNKTSISNGNSLIPVSTVDKKLANKGKIYEKCELAKELYHKHRMPMEQIPKWVCIAQHESSFKTAAVGRLNTDGSADHGLFQISDLYWCSHDKYGGKACNIPCDKLLDSDLTDDIKCIRVIYEEHTRISGDGFNAWTVYKPHCRNTGISQVKQCFTDKELEHVLKTNVTNSINSLEPSYKSSPKSVSKGKVYNKCELVQELLHKHKMPLEQVPTWVCIAQQESSFNTAAVGRLNLDGSADHGLFQISDLYWCSHDKYGGKACNIPCENLLDSDIRDDVQCIKIIFDEHTRISGDGFNAWTVYKPHCRHRKIEEISSCLTPNQIELTNTKQVLLKTSNNLYHKKPDTEKISCSHNPFLSGLKHCFNNKLANYDKNPFLQNVRISSGSQIHETIGHPAKGVEMKNPQNYQHNLFLSEYIKYSAPSPNNQHSETSKHVFLNQNQFETFTKTTYKNNPFLNGQFSSQGVGNKFTAQQGFDTFGKMKYQNNPFLNSHGVSHTFSTSTRPARPHEFRNNPFLSHIKQLVSEPKVLSFSTNKSSRIIMPDNKIETHKNYINTNDFRTTMSSKTFTTYSTPTSSMKGTTFSSTTGKNHTKSIERTTTLKPTTQFTKPTFTSTATAKTTTFSRQNSKATTKTQAEATTKRTTATTTKKHAAAKTKTIEKWQNQRINNATVTTKAPQISTTNRAQQKYNHRVTTAKPKTSITKIDISNQRYIDNNTLTQNASNLNKLEEATLTKNYTTTSTTKPLATTENWRKWDKTTTNYYKTTASKPLTTTENWRKWDKTTTNYYKTTTSKPLTTTENWRKWDKSTINYYKTTTLKPLTTENWRKWDRPKNKTRNRFEQNSTSVKSQKIKETWERWFNTTTTKPQMSTTDWRKRNMTTTRKSAAEKTIDKRNQLKNTTTQPQTSTENWRKWDRPKVKNSRTTETKPNTKSYLEFTTTKPQTSTENWRTWDKMTTKKASTTTTNHQKTNTNVKNNPNLSTTKTNQTNIWRGSKMSTTTKPSTSTENWIKSNKTTTTTHSTIIRNNKNTSISITSKNSPRTTNNWKNTTAAITANSITTNHYDTTTQSLRNTKTTPLINNSSSIDATDEYKKYKNDPFSHPFFAKVKEQLKLLQRSLTTKVPSFMDTKFLNSTYS